MAEGSDADFEVNPFGAEGYQHQYFQADMEPRFDTFDELVSQVWAASQAQQGLGLGAVGAYGGRSCSGSQVSGAGPWGAGVWTRGAELCMQRAEAREPEGQKGLSPPRVRGIS